MKLFYQLKNVISFHYVNESFVIYRDIDESFYSRSFKKGKSYKLIGEDSENIILKFEDQVLLAKRKKDSSIYSFDLILTDLYGEKQSVFLKDNFPLLQHSFKIFVKGYGENAGRSRQIELPSGNLDFVIEYDFRPKIVHQENYFGFQGRKRNSISCISTKNGGSLWTHELADMGVWYDYDKKEYPHKAQEILGGYKNNLYIYLNSGRILILDTRNGQQINVLENHLYVGHSSFDGMFHKNIQLDQQSGKLIQLFREDYTEVDLETLTVTHVNIPEMKDSSLETTAGFVYDSNYIYFTDHYHNKLGAFNRSTRTIDWQYGFETSNGPQTHYGRTLTLKGNRLYVLDNKNILKIFQMTDV